MQSVVDYDQRQGAFASAAVEQVPREQCYEEETLNAKTSNKNKAWTFTCAITSWYPHLQPQITADANLDY